MTPSERGRAIHRLGDLIAENLDELAELDSLDNGKPMGVARAADVPLAADLFWYMAGWATKLRGRPFPSLPYMPGAEFHAYTVKEPVGVVGQIIPWNFPLLMAAWKVGPALATGCTIVLKPAEQTPLSALRLGELALEAGIPAGVLNVVTGYGDAGRRAGRARRRRQGRVHRLDRGRQADRAGRRREPQARVARARRQEPEHRARRRRRRGRDRRRGEGDLLQPGRGLHRRLAAATSSSRSSTRSSTASPRARTSRSATATTTRTEMGPLVSQEQFDRVTGYLKIGPRRAPRPVTGGKRDRRPRLLRPADGARRRDDRTCRSSSEEIFGPVVAAIPFSDDVAAPANDSVYGLAAGVWTRDISKAAHQLAARTAGTVHVNTYHIYDAALPFGGYKQSGWGREMGEEVLKPTRRPRSVFIGL